MFSSFGLNCYFNLTTQKNIDQGGVRYTVTTYPTNPTKVTVSPASVHPSFLPLSPQPISAIPPLSSSSPVVGTTDLRYYYCIYRTESFPEYNDKKDIHYAGIHPRYQGLRPN